MNGIEVNPSDQGVRNRHELDALVERAAEESPPVLPTIEELNEWNPKDHDAYMDWLREERKQRGDNWNFQVHPTIHTWPQHRHTSTCSHQWRRISWLWME